MKLKVRGAHAAKLILTPDSDLSHRESIPILVEFLRQALGDTGFHKLVDYTLFTLSRSNLTSTVAKVLHEEGENAVVVFHKNGVGYSVMSESAYRHNADAGEELTDPPFMERVDSDDSD